MLRDKPTTAPRLPSFQQQAVHPGELPSAAPSATTAQTPAEGFNEGGHPAPPATSLEAPTSLEALGLVFSEPGQLDLVCNLFAVQGPESVAAPLLAAFTAQEPTATPEEPETAASTHHAEAERATAQELAAGAAQNQPTLLPPEPAANTQTSPTSAAPASKLEPQGAAAEAKKKEGEIVLGQGFSAADFLTVSTSGHVFNDIVYVWARSLSYEWPDQLDALTRACHSSSKHGLGPIQHPWPPENLSWLSMGYDRVAQGWSERQRFCSTGRLTNAQKEKAERLIGPVRMITARVQGETSLTTSVLNELRFNVCTMVETFLGMCIEGFVLHGPLLGYARLSETFLH